MRVYLEVARRTFGRMTTYRGATLAGIVTNTAFGFLLAYVLLAAFAERAEIGGFDATDAVTFTFVSQGLLGAVGLFFSDNEIADRIRTGDVVGDLARPVDFQGWWAAAAYGRAAYLVVFRGVPPFVLGGTTFHLRLPPAAVWPWFVVSVALAVGVCFAWRFIVNLWAFWLFDIRGPVALAGIATAFLTGMYVPIVFFPPWLEALARGLPFAAMLQLPVEVFLGKHRGPDLAGALAMQVAWGVVLVGAGRVVLARAARRVVVQGG